MCCTTTDGCSLTEAHCSVNGRKSRKCKGEEKQEVVGDEKANMQHGQAEGKNTGRGEGERLQLQCMGTYMVMSVRTVFNDSLCGCVWVGLQTGLAFNYTNAPSSSSSSFSSMTHTDTHTHTTNSACNTCHEED